MQLQGCFTGLHSDYLHPCLQTLLFVATVPPSLCVAVHLAGRQLLSQCRFCQNS